MKRICCVAFLTLAVVILMPRLAYAQDANCSGSLDGDDPTAHAHGSGNSAGDPTGVDLYVDWGDGGSNHISSGFMSTSGSRTHTYSANGDYNVHIITETDSGGYADCDVGTFSVSSYVSGGSSCSDTDVATWFSDACKSSGASTWFNEFNITTDPANIAYAVNCPNDGPYGCTYIWQQGSQYWHDCKNGGCAGGGPWTFDASGFIQEQGGTSYSCPSVTVGRGPPPPNVKVFDVNIVCTPVSTPPPPPPPNNVPIGSHDAYSGSVPPAQCQATGWAVDPDHRDQDVTVNLWEWDAGLGTWLFRATRLASDFRPGLDPQCTGATCGYTFFLDQAPISLPPDVNHRMVVTAVDLDDPSQQPWLSATDKTINCYGPPQVTIAANPVSVPYNGTTTVSWSSTNADSCTASGGSAGWPGARPTTGTFASGPLTAPTTYTITCTNAVGSTLQSASVAVAAPPGPTVTITKVEQPDYCKAGPAVTITWNYSSPVGSPQTQWQMQVQKDPAFVPPQVYGSGIQPGANTTASTGQGILQFGKTYWVRVRGWDAFGTPSAFSVASFTTPPGAYPQASFTTTPTTPFAKQPTVFTDTSNYYTGSPLTRLWNFGDGTTVPESPGTGTITHTYLGPVTGLTATLTVSSTNSTPNTCAASKTFNVNKPIPTYKEVAPGTTGQ